MLIEISPLTNEIPDGPLVGSGTLTITDDEKEIDVQVSFVPIHPADSRDLERFKGKTLTVSMPEITLQKLQHYKEVERDKMRYSEQYAAVCRQLTYAIMKEARKRKLTADCVLAVDHSGQLLTMFVAKIADMEAYEIRRVKKKNEDGSMGLTILLPQNLYPLDGKKFILLDEFINTGFTLNEAIRTIKNQGGIIQLIGAFKSLEGKGRLLEANYPDIPVVTLE